MKRLIRILTVAFIIGLSPILVSAEDFNSAEAESAAENIEVEIDAEITTSDAIQSVDDESEEIVITDNSSEEGEESISEAISIVEAGDSDQDAMFEAYLLQELGIGGNSARRSRRNLSFPDENTRKIYEALQNRIQEIAENGGSTTFTLTRDDLGGEYLTFDSAENFSATMRTVLTMELMYNPYELFWYDKTVGTDYRYGFVRSDTGINVGTIYIDVMTVASGYRKDPDVNNVVTSEVSSVHMAAENAAQVVTECSEYDDLEMLKAYKDYICSVVDYDYDAANSGIDSFGANVDAWQIVRVFDGDDSTNVVCEGYAKAFQYLCDLSTFSLEDTECFTVTGDMSVDGKTAAKHMWNLIRYENQSYLADVTNSDSGAIGSNEALFLTRNASGENCASAYTVQVGNRTVSYTYDDVMIGIYSEEILCVGEAVKSEDSNSEAFDDGNSDADDTGDGGSDTGASDAEESGSGNSDADNEDNGKTPDHATGGHSAHTWSAWSIVLDATDTESGIQERSCTVCGKLQQETIAARCKIVQNKDGTFSFYRNGKVDTSYSGIRQIGNEWIYFKNGIADFRTSDLIFQENVWYYVRNGKVDWSFSGLTKYQGIWYYVENGKLNWNYSNLILHNGTWYYVHNDKIDFSYETLAQVNGRGTWYYVKNGKIDWSATTLARVDGKGTWYYVKKGKLDWNYNGLTKYYGTWYHIENGRLNWNYSNLILYDGTWYYVHNGKIDFSYETLAQVNGRGTWYYVKNGKIDWSATTLARVDGKDTWYYVKNGKLDWNYDGLTKYYGTWYYIENGRLNWNYSNLILYNGIWYYVHNGKIDFSYETLAQVNGRGTWYYVKNGKIDWSYNGAYYYRGVKYAIVGGIVK